ncbi:Pol protein [Phytophthora palmivora]|uniref:Pol protein n=1 Tax=Phytophthora palmivora TaxID=4796 RepID=A0A2P4YDF8_9STRA|nr:Pol protein [Phytophthora palmivora]
MDKCDVILGMPWIKKHEPWIDWRGKTIGASRPAVSGRAQVSHAPPLFEIRPPETTDKELLRNEKCWESLTPTKGTDQAGNIGPQAAAAAEESAEGVSCVVPHSESETPPARPVEEQYHVFDGVSGLLIKVRDVRLEVLPEVSALLKLEELSIKDFLVELKAGEIAEMMLLKPDTSPEDLNSSSVMDEDVLEGFTNQRATHLGSEILKKPEDPVYPLVKGLSDCEAIDAFFAETAKSGMVRGSKSMQSTPIFCVRKPTGK